MDDGLLPLLGCIVDSFREKKTRCSYGDEDCAAIESGTDDLIPVNFQDTGVVLNPGFLLCVCHGGRPLVLLLLPLVKAARRSCAQWAPN
jgi:hypothetical protein